MTDVCGIYIHIPFCLSKCIYCDFYSVTDISLIGEFLGLLKKEIALYKNFYNNADIDSIYIGGGTPSLLRVSQISSILGEISKNFNILKNAEITIEANPQDISGTWAKDLANTGVNRVSLGIQSFINEDLKYLYRRHDEKAAIKSIKLLQNAQFKLNIDLIWNIPFQNEKSLFANLKKACDFNPAHISLYELTISKSTPLWHIMKKDSIDMEKDDLYLGIFEYLREKGYKHYEVSNYAINEDAFSVHNCKYWNHSPYLGMGPSAHSFSKNMRWSNHSSIIKYCKKLKNGEKPVEMIECLDESQLKMEKIMLGLRTKWGFDYKIIKNDRQNKSILKKLLKDGYLLEENGRLLSTFKGMLVADHLSSLFEVELQKNNDI